MTDNPGVSGSSTTPPATPLSATQPPAGAPATHSISLRFQLLIGVNVVLAVLLTLALVADYQRELAHHLRHEKAALVAEAETIAAAIPALDPVEAASIQRLLDSITSGVAASDVPRHQLRVVWNGSTIEPRLRRDKPILNYGSAGDQIWESKDYVIGKCSKPDFTVHVAEPLIALRREIGYETLERLVVLIIAGLVAMGIVDFILVRALVRPMENLSRTVEAIGSGKLGTQVIPYRTAELAVLGQSINQMSRMLAAHDREVNQQMLKARRLQQHLLPAWPAIPGLEAERRFLPATEVTGDYHDAFALPNGEWLFCIADCTGHGIPAAMTAAMLKVLFHQAVSHTHDPQQILLELNRNFGAVVLPGDFATMLIVHWQPQSQRITYANAGHEPGLLLHRDGQLELMESDGLMVGAVPEASWAARVLSIAPGDRLFMFTDGAVEVFNPRRELFGRKRLSEVFVESSSHPPTEAIARIIHRMDEFREDRPYGDDVTLLLLEFADPAAAASSA
jgi:serine phosphatase RsbU (regulator of sigma subunit)